VGWMTMEIDYAATVLRFVLMLTVVSKVHRA
jgi:hypothetical protein